jgi:hypothetical protein
MLADELDYVVGVDTHRDRHTLAVVVAPSGGVIGSGRCGRARVATWRRFALPRSTRLERVSGRLKGPVITAPDSLGT